MCQSQNETSAKRERLGQAASCALPKCPFLGALVPQFVSQPLLAPREHFTLCIALAEAETGCLLFYLAQPMGSGTQDNFFGHKGKTGMK